MKKGLLILLGMFMMVSTVEAKNGNYLTNNIRVDYSYENSVNFIERGVEFFIFTNGDFDFNSNYNDTYYDYNGLRTRRSGITIDRDYRGRIRRVGDVFINYDYRGNVSRVGNVFMKYYRNRLTNVGHLNVQYNRFGNPVFYGNVKDNFYYDNGIRINLNLGNIWNYNDAYFYKSDFRRNYTKFREDNRYFYYKSNRNAKIGKRSAILKRRKPVASNRSNNAYKKRTNISYRKSNTKRKTNTRTNRSSEIQRRNTRSGSRRKIEEIKKPLPRNSSKVNSRTKKENTRKAKARRKTNDNKKISTRRRD
ncbi:hypothetical protein CW731_15325 [Polaribacter sp. ALD11]|uniref:hypothetical protein n=1 Tax=Polaribacter sp. ALD11 TaxID=2058137 RepID=UPI000C303515|nr:hypothetical protein [Polaribacter sp. ALD11]AUC86568.1 hypothetical protein CW731_15325 [Polaribacter sp. ALD11]